ncbi:MAG TPA: type II toxin-antitoxin system VapC family toxin [Opitutales bacterium]|nr:type II toxin-antitoxin system VapC family toxin [Opitutales bacterium]
MKTLYFDSNYLFRLYSTEAGSEAVQKLAGSTQCITSAWHGRAELASALLRKRRESALPDEAIQEIRYQIRDDRENGCLVFLDHSESITARLEWVLEQAPKSTFIRAADALHLACASEHGYKKVYSNDRHFLLAASLFGLEGVNVIGG